MDLKTLIITRVHQLAQEQANTKNDCLSHFGGFRDEVSVPVNLELEPNAKLLEVFEQLVAAKAAQDSFTQ